MMAVTIPKRFVLLAVRVAGAPRHMKLDQLSATQHGDSLELEREPENMFDPNAVRVHDIAAGLLCGYIPATLAPMVSALLANGYDLRCTVDYIDSAAHTLVVSLTLPMLAPHK